MANYATVSDLKNRLQSTYDHIYSDDTLAEDDLNAAESEINGSVNNRYELPIKKVEVLYLLKDWTLTLVEERTFARGSSPVLAESVKERIALVRGYLAMVRSGDFKLVGCAENRTIAESNIYVDCDRVDYRKEQLRDY